MECAEKTGVPGFGFFRQGAKRVSWGRKRIPEEELPVELPVAESKDGGWVYTGRHPGSKMEIRSTI